MTKTWRHNIYVITIRGFNDAKYGDINKYSHHLVKKIVGLVDLEINEHAKNTQWAESSYPMKSESISDK